MKQLGEVGGTADARVRCGRSGVPQLTRSWAFALAALATSACAETTGIAVEPGGGGSTNGPTGGIAGEPVAEDCGEAGIACGGGCCAPGTRCSQGACLPDVQCSNNDDCHSDSVCGGQTCVSWLNFPSELRRNSACRQSVDLAEVEPVVQCSWPGNSPPSVLPDLVQVISAPMVVDFNFDDDPSTIRPSIVFVSYSGVFNEENGVLRVIDGETCELQASIPGSFPFTPEVAPALGDINGDGRPDIVAIDEEQAGAAPRSGVAAFEWSGTGTDFRPLWRTPSGSIELIQGVALHDLDNDGIPEILTEGSIFDASGRQLVTIPGGALEPPIVTDIDGEFSAELVTSEGLFTWDRLEEELVPKGEIWDPTASVDGLFVGLANFAELRTRVNFGDDSVEMVVVGRNGEIWLKQIDGFTHLHVDPGSIAGGPPVIADFDGDGRMEFASPGREFLTVFDMDCKDDDDFFLAEGCGAGNVDANRDAILWQTPSQGANSGAAVFDFDGDQRAEVVYADQCFMRVYDGRNGEVLFSVPRSSTTRWEYPVVADVDGDGHSEIVTGSNDGDVTLACPSVDPLHPTTRFEATHGVTVWREPEDRWSGSRPVWNQHTYYVSHVHDDGTIPSTFETPSNWDATRQGHNTFRQNSRGESGISLSLVDLTTAGDAAFDCIGNSNFATVSGRVCNRGLEPIAAEATSVTLVRDDQPSTPLCTTNNQIPLAPGGCSNFSCTIDVPLNQAPFDVRVMASMTSSDQAEECFGANNWSLVSRVACTGIQ